MIYQGDCLDILPKLEKRSIDLVVTSPPYDTLRNYKETCTWDWYQFEQVVANLYEVLKDGGVVIWVVADKTENGSETGTSFKQALRFIDYKFNLHDTMIYRKINYMPMNHGRYEQEFEYMFCFSKGKPKTFNPIKIPCKYAGQSNWGTPTYYKDESDNLVEMKRKTIADTKLHGNIFEYRIGSTNETSKYNHPAMFPLDLARDMISSWSNKGDIVLDCFMGAGTTGVACAELGREFIGIEIVSEYFEMAKERLRLANMKKRLF